MMRILFYDIETSPNISYTWGFYEQNVIEIVKNWELLCVAYKWLGEKDVHCMSRQGEKTDKNLTKKIWRLLNEADVVVAHNGLSFDNKKVTAKFIEHGLTPPTPYKTIDTKFEAQKVAKFNSNKLDEIGKLLDVGRKLKHEGFEMWQGCMDDSPKWWKKMMEYNKHDVVLLENIYHILKPWMKTHPAIQNVNDDKCIRCGGTLQKRGFAHFITGTYQRYRCNSCGGWNKGRFSLSHTSRLQLIKPE